MGGRGIHRSILGVVRQLGVHHCRLGHHLHVRLKCFTPPSRLTCVLRYIPSALAAPFKARWLAVTGFAYNTDDPLDPSVNVASLPDIIFVLEKKVIVCPSLCSTVHRERLHLRAAAMSCSVRGRSSTWTTGTGGKSRRVSYPRLPFLISPLPPTQLLPVDHV